MSSGYTLKWGKNKDGKAIRSKNNGPWRVMDIPAEEVKVCALEPWHYEGKFKDKPLKELAAWDAEYLEWHLTLLGPESPNYQCIKLLFGK